MDLKENVGRRTCKMLDLADLLMGEGSQPPERARTNMRKVQNFLQTHVWWMGGGGIMMIEGYLLKIYGVI